MGLSLTGAMDWTSLHVSDGVVNVWEVQRLCGLRPALCRKYLSPCMASRHQNGGAPSRIFNLVHVRQKPHRSTTLTRVWDPANPLR